MKTLINQEPLLKGVSKARHFEGDIISGVSQDGYKDESKYQDFKSEFKIDKDDLIKKGPRLFIENCEIVAKEMREAAAKAMIDKINQVTEETGNIVDGKGKRFSFELFMEMLDKYPMEFDENKNPIMPTVIVSPAIALRVKEELPVWETNPVYKNQLDNLIERKRKDWNDRESYRKLVD
ncbi:MAG: hypothetical protein LHV68_13045 [Elusimicrobia bacterium]|nr:hypothetical protein [Candidatus Liberimonas magnetica]